MTPGPSIYYECISCKKTIEITTIGSGNNSGARYWTDGFVFTPMLRETLTFGKCPHCRNLFWVKGLKYFGEVDWMWGEDLPDKAWGKTKTALKFEASDHLSALENNFFNNIEEEKLLRIRTWWKLNDSFRNTRRRKRFFRSSETKNIQERLFCENLAALDNMLDEKIQSERLLKAEIAREQCRFEECNKLLNFEFDESLKDAKEFIGKCNDEKISVVTDMTDWLKEKQRSAQELYTTLKENYIKEGISYVKAQAIAKGIATEENFLSVIHNLTVKEFLELRGSYNELYSIHFPKPVK
jgi:hypothetical protein